ncbi:MAG: PilT/PilU family type 4a pilus ATPase [Planctomycetota bacterium]
MNEHEPFDFHTIATQASEREASDIHLQTGEVPFLRIHGEIEPIAFRQITNEDLASVARLVCGEKGLGLVDEIEAGAVDRSYSVSESCRLRVSIAKTLMGYTIVARLIPNSIPTIDELELPQVFKRIALAESGFVLIGGVTGSGKSTTVAAMLEFANANHRKHVVTVEDPIEYVHKPNQCIFSRREIGHHLDHFANGLRSALRQDPDIILVGEMRDRETMRAAIQAAETGHLVFATVHAAEVDDMPERVIGSFPEMEQPQIRQQLANTGLAFIAQKLVRRSDKEGRTAAFEILLMNNAARNLIRSNKSFNLPSVMQTESRAGMITMTQSLINLFQAGKIDGPTLVYNASNKERAREVMLKDTGLDVSEPAFLDK